MLVNLISTCRNGNGWAGEAVRRCEKAQLVASRKINSSSLKPVLKTEQSLLARERRTILQWNPVEKKGATVGCIDFIPWRSDARLSALTARVILKCIIYVRAIKVH